jgi:putative Holliday junction resolvase
MKRIMAVDWGERRVGIALSDESRTIASPLEVLSRSPGLDKDIGKIKELAAGNEVEIIVLGMPIRLDGSVGQAAEEVTVVAERMRDVHGLTVVTWDERLSTAEAERALIGGDVSRKKRKGLIDQVAAAIFLQAYLDSGAWRRL